MEEVKKVMRMKTIYKALEEGWTVKKSQTTPRTFEFTKNSPEPMVTTDEYPSTRRSISAPLVKKNSTKEQK